MIKAAVIGDPISHSLSPKLHGYWLKKYNIEGTYIAKHVKSDELEHAVQSMIDEGYAGFNVTIPHKESIFNLCHETTRNAALTHAVNTIIIKNGQILGDNSDASGFINNLKKFQPNFSLKNKNAFLIGAGGAARALAFALIDSEIKNIFITNRNQEKAQELITDFRNFAQEKNMNMHFLSINDFAQNLNECDLLVNSTSLGMQGQPDLNLDLQNLKPSAIVYDIVYKPLYTKLLNQARNQGNPIVTGIGMLAYQAAVGFEQWFGIKPEVDDELLKYLVDIAK